MSIHRMFVGFAAIAMIAVSGCSSIPAASIGTSAAAGATSTPSTSAAAAAPWWLDDDECGEAPAEYGCAGELAPGTHTSGGLSPSVTYTVPTGWVNNRDWSTYFAIFPDTPAARAALVTGGVPTTDILIRPFDEPIEGCGDAPRTDIQTRPGSPGR